MKWHIPENTPKFSKPLNPTVTVYSNGKIRFNSFAIWVIGLKNKDGIAFGQDEEEKKDWYVKKDSKGFTVVLKNDGSSDSVYVSNKFICTSILHSLELLNSEYVVFKIIPDETKSGFSILTSNPVKVKTK